MKFGGRQTFPAFDALLIYGMDQIGQHLITIKIGDIDPVEPAMSDVDSPDRSQFVGLWEQVVNETTKTSFILRHDLQADGTVQTFGSPYNEDPLEWEWGAGREGTWRTVAGRYTDTGEEWEGFTFDGPLLYVRVALDKVKMGTPSSRISQLMTKGRLRKGEPPLTSDEKAWLFTIARSDIEAEDLTEFRLVQGGETGLPE